MAGAMHRMGVYLGLIEDGEFADYATDGDGYAPAQYAGERGARGHGGEDYTEARHTRGARASVSRIDERAYSGPAGSPGYADYSEGAERGEIEPYRAPGEASYQITALHPRTYNEARTIGEHFRRNTPVIMNLTEMDDADAKRLVDFAAGLTFGLHGRIERVTAKVFLLSPRNVTVTAQDKARIAENGFFNQS